jgi:hypothetical protein
MSTLVQNPAKRKARRIANFVAPAETPQVVEPTPAPVELPVITAPVSCPAPAMPTGALAELLACPVPASTRTYAPVSHRDLIDAVKEELDKRGLVMKDECYQHNRSGRQLFGHMTIGGGNGEQDLALGFRNSYDKSLLLGAAAGARVIICSNLMFAGDFKVQKMHTPAHLSAGIQSLMREVVDTLEAQFKRIQIDTDKLKQVEVNPRLIHEILGELFYSESVVSEAQLRIIRGELREQTNFGDGTLWDIYNHTTEALKTTPSGLVISRHIDAHQFYMQHT